MNNLRDYITMFDIQKPITNGLVILSYNAYNHMCDNHPDKELEWFNVDSWLHRVTGAPKFIFEESPEDVYIWNEETQTYE